MNTWCMGNNNLYYLCIMDKGKHGSHEGAQDKGKKAGKYDVHVAINASADEILKATLRPISKGKKKN